MHVGALIRRGLSSAIGVVCDFELQRGVSRTDPLLMESITRHRESTTNESSECQVVIKQKQKTTVTTTNPPTNPPHQPTHLPSQEPAHPNIIRIVISFIIIIIIIRIATRIPPHRPKIHTIIGNGRFQFPKSSSIR